MDPKGKNQLEIMLKLTAEKVQRYHKYGYTQNKINNLERKYYTLLDILSKHK